MKEIYLDNAAATPIDERVQREMIRAAGAYGNPSSYNDRGREASQELLKARKTVARFLGAHPEEVIFTSSGSEANTMAILGLAQKASMRHDAIISTPIEHLSVLEPLRHLSDKGHDVHYLKVTEKGTIDVQDLEKKLTQKTLLVSVMYANNEIGTTQPIVHIGKLIKVFRTKHQTSFPLFHVDACQAAGFLDMDVNHLGVDLLTFNGSKIYGPRGIGVLYVRKGVQLARHTFGGGQERGLRAGTENLPAIVGVAKAISIISKKESTKLASLRDYFFDRIAQVLPAVRVNGETNGNRLPNNIHISIPDLDSEPLLLELDKHGVRAGSGSACTARSVEPSHVLRAIGVKAPYVDGALRFTLGRTTTREDVGMLLDVLPRIVARLRKRYVR